MSAAEPSLRGLHVHQTLDVRGLERTVSYLKALERLSQMSENDILELHIDDGEALDTIPFGLRAEGHEIIVSEPAKQGVRLLVRKRPLIP